MADVSGVDNLTSGSSGSSSLTGIKSAIDNLNTAKVETTVTVNSHALSGNVTVTNADLGAVPTTTTVNGKALSANITLGLASSDFANQGTATTVLHGNAAGNPAFGAVVEADQTLADNTTNDVSTTKHGYAPKAPNDSTKFLRGDGTWAAPASGLTFKNGVTTHDVSATGTQNIAHGLGTTPKEIDLVVSVTVGTNWTASSNGTYNGSTTATEYHGHLTNGTGGITSGTSSTKVIRLEDSGGNVTTATVTFDATNIIVVWDAAAMGANTANIMWKARG